MFFCRGKSAALYGVSAGLIGAYMCNWRDLLQYVPVYNLKYKGIKVDE